MKQNLKNLSMLFNSLKNSVWTVLEKEVPILHHMFGYSLCICLYVVS